MQMGETVHQNFVPCAAFPRVLVKKRLGSIAARENSGNTNENNFRNVLIGKNLSSVLGFACSVLWEKNLPTRG